MPRRCEITDFYAKEIGRSIKRKHNASRRRFMSIETREDFNRTVRKIQNRLNKICKRFK